MDRTGETSRKYSRVKTRDLLVDMVFTLFSIAVFQVFLAGPLAGALESVKGGFYVSCALFTSGFLFFLYILGMPLHFYDSYIIEHRFGLSRQNAASWLKDQLKSAGLSLALSVLCVGTFYFLVRNFHDTWWLYASVLWILFTVVMARLFPVLIIPLFFRYSSIENGPLKESIMELSRKAGISLLDVCQIDLGRKTAKANAALVGLGKTRKVIMGDTLMNAFSKEEILAVVAHEMGHYKHRHILQHLIFNSLTTLAGLYVLYVFSGEIAAKANASGLSDIYLLPTLFFISTVSGIALLPAQNLFSRSLERQADGFSLRITDSADAFIGAMEKLAEINLAEKEPPLLKKLFLYSHPPINERISVAERFRKNADVSS